MFEEDGKMERGREEEGISFAEIASNTVCYSSEKSGGESTLCTSAKGHGLYWSGKTFASLRFDNW